MIKQNQPCSDSIFHIPCPSFTSYLDESSSQLDGLEGGLESRANIACNCLFRTSNHWRIDRLCRSRPLLLNMAIAEYSNPKLCMDPDHIATRLPL